jgi:signal peptidase I
MEKHLKKLWKFIWSDESIWSWLANIGVAFLVIRFLLYPLLGIILGTPFPIVAVVSESMEHGLHNDVLCGREFHEFRESFDNYWQVCGEWYENKGITKEQFSHFPFSQGFSKGDIIILWRAHEKNLQVGDVLIFQGNKPQPIIHRIVALNGENGDRNYQTKGDHNSDSIEGDFGETTIGQERIYGQGLLKIPYLGWIKIVFVDLVRPLGINIQR